MSAADYWEGELGKLSAGTVEHYRIYMDGFLGFMGTDLEGLYRLHKGYVEDGDARSNRVVPLRLAEYIRGLVSGGFSAGHGHNVKAAVLHFFMANVLDFPFRSSDIPRYVAGGSRVVLRDEIRRWYDLCVGTWFEYRNKGLLMVSKDLGFRQSDVSALDVEDVLDARVIDGELGRFRVFEEFITRKMGVPAYPHWGPEAEKAVMDYLGDRESGPLFLDVRGDRMTPNAIGSMFYRMKLKEGTPKLSHHSLRKFHRTALEARMRESYVKKLQGKATDPYIHPEQTGELTEAYIRHYDALMIFRESAEVDQLRQELEDTKQDQGDLERRLRDAERYIEQQRMEQAIRDELERRKR